MRHPDTSIHRHIFLEPGELYVADRPSVIETILGSCIAVTMHSSRLRHGAICHCQLPEGSPHGPGDLVVEAIPRLLHALLARGATRDELVVKLFGGSTVLNSTAYQRELRISLGDQNVNRALHLLHELQLPLAARDTGGDTGRKLYFYTDSGEVYIRRQRSSPAKRNAARQFCRKT